MRIATSIKLPLLRPSIVLSIVFNLIGTLRLFTEPVALRSLSNESQRLDAKHARLRRGLREPVQLLGRGLHPARRRHGAAPSPCSGRRPKGAKA